jgi:hypothetical protein
MSDPDSDLPSAEDPVAESNARKREVRRRKADQDVLRKLMHTPEGRDWLYRFLEDCHMMDTPFVPGAETNTVMFRLGEQNIGKRMQIAAETASVDLYMTMIKEHLEELALLDAQARERNAKFDEGNRAATLTDEDQGMHLPKPVAMVAAKPTTVDANKKPQR